jgi:hypothetical protein
MKDLKDDKLTIQKAVLGDGAALALLTEYLQSMTRCWGADHARIEAQRISIVALGYAKEDKVKVLDMLQEEIIKQTDK